MMRGLLLVIILTCDVGALTSRFKSLKCVSLNESIIFHNCFLKPYSRNFSTMNLAFTHSLPIEAPLKADIMIKYRYGTIFRQIFHAEVDWCDVIGQVQGNKVIMKIASVLKDSAPKLFRPCPLSPARFDLVNMTFNDDMWLVPIPQGLYRHEYTIFKMIFVAFNNEAVSDLKTSW